MSACTFNISVIDPTGCLPALSIFQLLTPQDVCLHFQYFLADFDKFRNKRFSHYFTGFVQLGLTSKRPGSNIVSIVYTFTDLRVNSYELLSPRMFLKMMENFRQRMRSASHSYRPAISPPCEHLDHYSAMFLNLVYKLLTGKQHRKVHKGDKYRKMYGSATNIVVSQIR